MRLWTIDSTVFELEKVAMCLDTVVIMSSDGWMDGTVRGSGHWCPSSVLCGDVIGGEYRGRYRCSTVSERMGEYLAR